MNFRKHLWKQYQQHQRWSQSPVPVPVLTPVDPPLPSPGIENTLPAYGRLHEANDGKQHGPDHGQGQGCSTDH